MSAPTVFVEQRDDVNVDVLNDPRFKNL